MKPAIIAMGAALAASAITYLFTGQGVEQAEMDRMRVEIAEIADRLSAAGSVPGSVRVLTFVEESEQDAWLSGVNRDGAPRPGPADDQKPLVSASNSMCFLTKVQVEGMNGLEDAAGCHIAVDEFTNWWQVHATQGPGTDASIACNARCIVWE